MSDSPSPYTLTVSGVSKSFGSTRAVNDASFDVKRGELVGIAGHNGAGKSTILKVVNGSLSGDSGTVTLDGVERSAGTTVAHPERLGVRTVYQELSLAPALRVDEIAAVFDRSARGFGWRTRAWRKLRAVLDEMFPDHGIRRDHTIRDLSLARRQMIECASTMVDGAVPPKLVILDEPTSALDAASTATFYAYLRKRAAEGVSAIVTTHRLGEMVENLSRIFVMRDGRVISEQDASTATKDSLVSAMGAAAHELERAASVPPAERPPEERFERAADAEPVVRIEQTGLDGEDEVFPIYAGEIVGLAGLEGHGQLQMIEAMHRAASSKPGRRKAPKKTRLQSVSVVGDAAYVSGDRGVRGIFSLWDVAKNISISSLKNLTAAGLIRPEAERRLVDEWYHQLGIKGRASDAITSLSGGTQQKALMARALAVGSDLLLLEDPTRGVDQHTKVEVYAMLGARAAAGQCVVWYSTENEELRNCDRVLVFRAGRIVGTLKGTDATEDKVISLSFEGHDHEDDAVKEIA